MATSLSVVVEVKVAVALHMSDGSTLLMRSGEVLRLPITIAAPLISVRLVALADQRIPLTQQR